MEKEKNKVEIVNIRLIKEKTKYISESLDSTDKIADFVSKILKGYDREVFCILTLSTEMKVINITEVSKGTISESVFSVSNAFKTAILSNAYAVIAAHNHPSGATAPSRADIDTTKALYAAGMIFSIPLVDHIIIGSENGYYSFLENGKIIGSKVSITCKDTDITKNLLLNARRGKGDENRYYAKLRLADPGTSNAEPVDPEEAKVLATYRKA